MKNQTQLSEPVATDVDLLLRSGRGDVEAFEELHSRFKNFVRAVVHRTMGGGSGVGDACQNSFIAIWRHAWRFDPARAKPTAWIAVTSRSIAIDALRANFRARSMGTVEIGEVELGDYRADPIDSDELRGEVWRALRGLPELQRTVIIHTCLRGLTCQQISELEGVPVGTVKTSKRRGLIRLRAAMQLSAEFREGEAPRREPAYAQALALPSRDMESTATHRTRALHASSAADAAVLEPVS